MAIRKSTWREMGLTDAEYQTIIDRLGRTPNSLEVALFAVMWSEHCGYKHSRRQFSKFPTTGPYVLQGPGENAGVIDIGDGQAIVMKVESHNHPSAVEPYQGAATGVGGILRDIFTMGARPIANLNSLRFGPIDSPRTRYLVDGVVAGIAGYGNCTGIPTVGGEVQFYGCYAGNPLVNAMAVGLLDRGMPLARGAATGVGNPVLVVGSATGRDGIHGATFASEELSEESEAKRPAVQVGDPFTEKLLIEACLAAIKSGCVVGIQDMGAAGLTSSACEMAARGKHGIEMDLDKVPRRETEMTPYELMLSESQERMLVVAKKGTEESLQDLFRRWGLEASVVGSVTDDQRLRLLENGSVVADVPAELLADAPIYNPPARKPQYLAKVQDFDPLCLPIPENLTEALLRLLSSPNITSKAPIFQQYDYMVQTNTVVGPGADAAVIRIKGTQKAVAFTTDCNPLYCYLDPHTGAAAAVAEAARNLVCSGAKPMALTDCLNYGNPEKPEVYWQFTESIDGMVEACRALDVPVISGNVSFYNEANGEAIYPTPLIGMTGLIEDLSLVTTGGFKSDGDLVVLLGETLPELGGTQFVREIHGKDAGMPPQLDLVKERALQELCASAIRSGLLESAHDLSEGGLATAIAESCITGELGAKIHLLNIIERVDALLFGESNSRILVSVKESSLGRLFSLACKFGVPCQHIGKVGGERLEITVHESSGHSYPAVSASVYEMSQRFSGGLSSLVSSD